MADCFLAFLYARFSDKKQAKGDSLRQQTEAARKWCKTNGAVLNESTYRDLGVSAFTGKHRKNPDKHGLALFLNGIQQGKIPPGSCLLLFNLDRLSREDIVPAVNLFTSILMAGIRIVQLNPEPAKVFTEASPMHDIMLAIVELSRGNSESQMKRVRIGKNWQGVRDKARRGEAITLPGNKPFWLDKVEGGYRKNERAEAVRLIFKLVREGMGATRVRWKVSEQSGLNLSRSTVQQVVKGRQVLGWWQPEDKDGVPIGEEIKLYPPVVTQKEWDEAQGALRGRINGPGKSQVRDRVGRRVYLFNSLLEDVWGKGYGVGKTSGGNGAVKYIPKSYLDGAGSCVSFPIEPFEASVVEALAEINPSEVLGRGDNSARELLAMRGRRDGLAARIEKVAAEMEGEEIPVLVKKIREWQAEVDELDREMARLRVKLANPKAEAWGDVKRLADRMGEAEVRMRFRSLCGQLVDRMVCVFGGDTRWRYAYVRIHFRDSPKFRVIVIHYRSASGKFVAGKPAAGQRREPVRFWDTWKEAIDDATPEMILEYMEDRKRDYEA